MVECSQALVRWLVGGKLQLLDMDLRKHTRLEEQAALDLIKGMEILVCDQVQLKKDQLVQTLKDLLIQKIWCMVLHLLIHLV